MPRCAWSTTPQAGVSPLVRVLVPARRRGPLEPGEGPAVHIRAALQEHDAPSRDGL
jgi:hypothetical protein